MDGFRFWKQGFWQSHLRDRPYHISALYVVDLAKFRCSTRPRFNLIDDVYINGILGMTMSVQKQKCRTLTNTFGLIYLARQWNESFGDVLSGHLSSRLLFDHEGLVCKEMPLARIQLPSALTHAIKVSNLYSAFTTCFSKCQACVCLGMP